MPLLQMSEEQALVTVETVKALLDGAERELEEEAVRSLSYAVDLETKQPLFYYHEEDPYQDLRFHLYLSGRCCWSGGCRRRLRGRPP